MDSLLALLTLHLTLQPACDTLVEGSLQVIAWQPHTASRAEAVQPLLQLVPLLLGISLLERPLLLCALLRTTETSQLSLKLCLHLRQLSICIHSTGGLHQPLNLVLEALGRKLLKLQLGLRKRWLALLSAVVAVVSAAGAPRRSGSSGPSTEPLSAPAASPMTNPS